MIGFDNARELLQALRVLSDEALDLPVGTMSESGRFTELEANGVVSVKEINGKQWVVIE